MRRDPRRRSARRIPVFLLVFFTACAAYGAPPCSQSGAQAWVTVEDYHPITPKTNFLLEGALRTDDCGAGGFYPYYGRAEAGFSFQPLKHLEVRPYYLMIVKRPGSKRIHGISLELVANNFKLGHWVMEDENRIEEEFVPTGTTTTYTNEIEFIRPLRLGAIRLAPYVEGETKYDLKYMSGKYTRAFIGIRKPLNRKMSLEAYYVRQFGLALEPGYANGIGFTLIAHY